MAKHDLRPSFIQIHYRSSYGKHVQTVQTRQWSEGIGTHGFGGFTTWLGSSIDADTMVSDMIDTVTPWSGSNMMWESAIVFNYPSDPDTLPNPVAVFPLTNVGALTPVAAQEAEQATFTFFDSAFNTVKYVFLDNDTTGSFPPMNYAALPALKQAFVDYITTGAHAWASRADLRPTLFRQAVWKYNDKLRKEYHLN